MSAGRRPRAGREEKGLLAGSSNLSVVEPVCDFWFGLVALRYSLTVSSLATSRGSLRAGALVGAAGGGEVCVRRRGGGSAGVFPLASVFQCPTMLRPVSCSTS